MESKGLGGLEIYKIAVELGAVAWEVYQKIPKQHQFHTGNQFLGAVDSIGANIAEGFGRFHYKDSINFYYYARGSVFESKHWAYLLYKRNLLEEPVYLDLISRLETEGLKLNNFINTIKPKSTPKNK
jgi:four helix bundle protein